MKTPRVTLLSGGVGGAKLAEGLYRVLSPAALTVIGNTGDDLVRHGLRICPDLDIVAYTLAGIVDADRGWGLRDETWNALDTLARLGEETWFRLGDRDLVTHILRTAWLAEGRTLTDATTELTRRLGLHARILPPSDGRIETMVRTPEGRMSFEEYFVREQCRPEILAVDYEAAGAAATAEALTAIADADLLVIAPSNPIASIGPILAADGIREALENARAPRIAVSPIVGGRSLKGPSDRMLAARGLRVDAVGVAQAYHGLIDALVIDLADIGLRDEIEGLGVTAVATETVMRSTADRERLARFILERHP